jgi:hypothetical protein
MPRPGEAPAPLYSGLPYGSNAIVNQMSEDIPEDDGDIFDDGTILENDGFRPSTPEEEFLFSGTDRPMEPLTTGMSFGAGADFTRFAHESNADLLGRVAQKVTADPASPKEARAWADRVARGF